MEKTSRYGYRLLLVASLACAALFLLQALSQEFDFPLWADARTRPSGMHWLAALPLPLLVHLLYARPRPGHWREGCALAVLVAFLGALVFGALESLRDTDGELFYLVDVALLLVILAGGGRALYGEFLAAPGRKWPAVTVGVAAAAIPLFAALVLGDYEHHAALEGLLFLALLWALAWLAVRLAGAKAGRIAEADPLRPLFGPASLRLLLAGVTWVLATAAAAYAALAVVNLLDEELKPEVKAALERAPRVPQAGNAFFFLQGLDAPEGTDPHALGVRITAYYREAERRPYGGGVFDAGHLYGGKRVALGKDGAAIRELCRADNPRCFGEYLGRRPAVARLVAGNALLLERYRVLVAYRDYEDLSPGSPATPLPAYQPLFSAVTVRNAQCALLVADGRAGACFEMLDNDIAFARRMLAGATEGISKNVAARLLHVHYQFLGDLLAARPEAARANAERVQRIAAPLSEAEKDMAQLGSDFLTLPGLLRAPSLLGQDWLEAGPLQPFLKTNATLNRAYEVHRMRLEAWRLPVARLDKEKVRYQVAINEFVDLRRQGVALLYNPVGKVLLAIEEHPLHEEYVLRLNDLDGLVRLVALQGEAIRAGVASAAMPGFLADAGPQLADPYSGAPMEWSPERRAIFFRTKSTRYRKPGTLEVFVPSKT